MLVLIAVTIQEAANSEFQSQLVAKFGEQDWSKALVYTSPEEFVKDATAFPDLFETHDVHFAVPANFDRGIDDQFPMSLAGIRTDRYSDQLWRSEGAFNLIRLLALIGGFRRPIHIVNEETGLFVDFPTIHGAEIPTFGGKYKRPETLVSVRAPQKGDVVISEVPQVPIGDLIPAGDTDIAAIFFAADGTIVPKAEIQETQKGENTFYECDGKAVMALVIGKETRLFGPAKDGEPAKKDFPVNIPQLAQRAAMNFTIPAEVLQIIKVYRNLVSAMPKQARVVIQSVGVETYLTNMVFPVLHSYLTEHDEAIKASPLARQVLIVVKHLLSEFAVHAQSIVLEPKKPSAPRSK